MHKRQLNKFGDKYFVTDKDIQLIGKLLICKIF